MSDYSDRFKLATKADVKFDTAKPFEIDVKRFRIPGLVFTSTCPHCGWSQEYSPDYFGYPWANGYERVVQKCQNCEEEYRFEICISVTVKVLEPAAPTPETKGSDV